MKQKKADSRFFVLEKNKKEKISFSKRKKADSRFFVLEKNKKAQQFVGMSFSMIFSIILIIFFIVIAFLAINWILDWQKCIRVGSFVQDFQDNVDVAWNSQDHEHVFGEDNRLPSKLEYVCFADLNSGLVGSDDILYEINDYDDENMFLYPGQYSCAIPAHEIEHINIQDLPEGGNPYCFEVDNGKVQIKLKKTSGENLVKIEKVE